MTGDSYLATYMLHNAAGTAHVLFKKNTKCFQFTCCGYALRQTDTVTQSTRTFLSKHTLQFQCCFTISLLINSITLWCCFIVGTASNETWQDDGRWRTRRDAEESVQRSDLNYPDTQMTQFAEHGVLSETTLAVGLPSFELRAILRVDRRLRMTRLRRKRETDTTLSRKLHRVSFKMDGKQHQSSISLPNTWVLFAAPQEEWRSQNSGPSNTHYNQKYFRNLRELSSYYNSPFWRLISFRIKLCQYSYSNYEDTTNILLLVVVLVLLLLFLLSSSITFMQGTNNYIPKLNHVSRVYSVAAIL
jgi:hypothetical protein